MSRPPDGKGQSRHDPAPRKESTRAGATEDPHPGRSVGVRVLYAVYFFQAPSVAGLGFAAWAGADAMPDGPPDVPWTNDGG